MAFTTADLDRLKAAFASGVTRVKIGDREVEYRSLSDLEKAIKAVEAELNGVSSDVADNPNVIQSTFSRGEK